jgi:hypothetical protein
MISAPLELGLRSDVTLRIPSLTAPLMGAAAIRKIRAMLFLDDIGSMLSIAGASLAGVAACSALLLLLA